MRKCVLAINNSDDCFGGRVEETRRARRGFEGGRAVLFVPVMRFAPHAAAAAAGEEGETELE